VGGTALEVDRARQLEIAVQALAFQSRYAEHPRTNEAKRLEALALLEAASVGNRTLDARRSQLVSGLRAESALPSLQRCEIVARFKSLDVERLPWTARTERLTGYTTIARSLIEEFPNVSVCYESLLSLAEALRCAPDAQRPIEVRYAAAFSGRPQDS